MPDEFINLDTQRDEGLPETFKSSKQFAVEEIKGIEETEDGLKVPFVISTGDLDRGNDKINPDGWDLDNYRKNPVVLWAHNSWSQPPIAKSLREWVEDGKLKSEALFMPKELSSFSHMIGQMYQKGFMKAVSVGFMAKKWTWSKDKDRPLGIDFEKQELLEYSAVPVPANPEALLEAKAAGIDTGPLFEWAVKILDGEGIWIPKVAAQKIFGELNTRKSFFIEQKEVIQPEEVRQVPVDLYQKLAHINERRSNLC